MLPLHAPIIPPITDRSWITGPHQHMLDPVDPWPQGYRPKDCWGAGQGILECASGADLDSIETVN